MSRTSSTFKKNQTANFGSKDSAYLSSVSRTRSPSPLRKSSSFTKSVRESRQLGTIENDYIKNLQQQVYYLELEANYLREQARKATQMHPVMTAEAERMVGKLKTLQVEADTLNLELRQKDANLEAIYHEKDRVLSRLGEEEAEKRKLRDEIEDIILLRQREKRQLSDEIAALRKERDMLSLENTRRANTLNHVATDKETLQRQLDGAENTISRLRNQLDVSNEQCQDLQLQLETKRDQILDAESHARAVEDKYVRNTSIEHDRTVRQLREEIISLRSQLTGANLSVDEERLLRSRTQDDSSDILSENSDLKHRVNELQRALDRERELRESTDEKRSHNLLQLTRLSDTERDLQIEVRRLEDLLLDEKERCSQLERRLSKRETMSTSLEMNSNSVRSLAGELDGKVRFLESENKQLRRDKDVLVDHVASLQQQLARRNNELRTSRSAIKDLAGDLQDVSFTGTSYRSPRDRSWNRLDELNKSMKSLNRSMERSLSPRSPRSPIATRKSRSRTRMSQKL